MENLPQRGADWESSASPRKTVYPVPSSVVTRGVGKGQGRSSDSSRQDISPGQGQTQRGASALCPPTETSPPLWNPSACHWVPSEWAGDPGVYRGQAWGVKSSASSLQTVRTRESWHGRLCVLRGQSVRGALRGKQDPKRGSPEGHRWGAGRLSTDTQSSAAPLLSGPTARPYFPVSHTCGHKWSSHKWKTSEHVVPFPGL